MKFSKRLIAGGLALALGIFSVACNKTDEGTTDGGNTDTPSASGGNKKISFVLDWTPNTNHTGVYVALEKGFFAEEGLDVEIIQPPEDGAIAAVASGQAQFGVSFQENVGEALAADAPAPITAVATIIDHNTSGLLSLQESEIENFAQLAGKKYATWGLPVEQAILKYAVEAFGGDFSQVEMVPHSGADAISLLQSKTVDAVWVYEAWDVVQADLHEDIITNYVPFVAADPILDFYTPVIISNNDFLQKDAETAKAFMRATTKGYEFAIENPKEAADILLKAVPELDEEMVRESQELLASYYKAEKDHWGAIDVERWAPFFDFMYAQGLINKELKAEGFTNDFLPNP